MSHERSSADLHDRILQAKEEFKTRTEGDGGGMDGIVRQVLLSAIFPQLAKAAKKNPEAVFAMVAEVLRSFVLILGIRPEDLFPGIVYVAESIKPAAVPETTPPA